MYQCNYAQKCSQTFENIKLTKIIVSHKFGGAARPPPCGYATGQHHHHQRVGFSERDRAVLLVWWRDCRRRTVDARWTATTVPYLAHRAVRARHGTSRTHGRYQTLRQTLTHASQPTDIPVYCTSQFTRTSYVLHNAMLVWNAYWQSF